MRRVAVTAAVAVATLVVAWNAVEFAGGYSTFPILLPFVFLPASALLLALTFFASCAAVVIALLCASRREFSMAAVLIAVFCIAWLLSPWFLGRPAFLLGFATRLRTLSTPAEIQRASEICLSSMPHGGRIIGPKKVTLDPADEEQNKRVWDALSPFRFVRLLDDSCVVFVEPPDVAFSWGGALAGHWGIHVLASRDARAPTHYQETLRFSERIILFRGH